jgi:hypothetical protein
VTSNEPLAVVLTGVFGVGKSTVLAELADRLEHVGAHYAALDLDWLAWAWPGTDDDEDGEAEHELMLENLASVLANLRRRGNDRYLLALNVATTDRWADLRRTLDMEARLVRLTLPLDEVRRRLATDPTSGRLDDLRRTEEALDPAVERAAWPVADLELANDRPVGEVAAQVLDWLGWLGDEPPAPRRP